MSNNKVHKIFKYSTPILALICAVMCAVSFGYAFDVPLGYFKASPLTYIFYAILALTFAASIAAAVTQKKCNNPENATAPNRRAMGLVMACSFTFYLVSLIITSRPQHVSIGLFSVIVAGSLVSISHFIILAFFSSKVSNGAKILSGLAAVFTPILIATVSYFDHAETLNSPHKLLFEFAFAAFALYYISELRLYTPEPHGRFLTAVSGISIVLSLCGGVSVVFEIMRSGFSILSLSQALLLATMASCAASKLLEPR